MDFICLCLFAYESEHVIFSSHNIILMPTHLPFYSTYPNYVNLLFYNILFINFSTSPFNTDFPFHMHLLHFLLVLSFYTSHFHYKLNASFLHQSVSSTEAKTNFVLFIMISPKSTKMPINRNLVHELMNGQINK